MKTIDFNRTPEFTERLPQSFLDWLKPHHETITYNGRLVELLAKEIGSNLETLSRWIYVGRHNLQDDKRIEIRNKMIENGWQLLSADACEGAIQNNQKIELLGSVQSDWLTTQIKGLFRPIKDSNGCYFLIAPRKRTKGYYLGNLTEGGHRDCFCKVS